MRVHEFAKLHNFSSKQLLEALQKEGFDVKSHMSVLTDKACEFLEKAFVKKPSSVKKVASAPKKEATSTNSESSQQIMQEVSQSKTVSSKGYVPEVKTEESQKKASDKPFIVKQMLLGDFAQKANIPVGDVIVSLLKEGKPRAKNQLLSEEDIYSLCRTYEITAEASSGASKKDILGGKIHLSTENSKTRLPVVVVMGHVDHGKTTLLDYIRKTRVAAREKGGITQHLGAYKVSTQHGDLVFLDTPGHEAFSKIRKRGASVADIAILMVAADDGIMPQTIESIKAIKALDIPVIVAINKIDRVEEQRIEVVKRQLAQQDMLPEEWGGQTICIPISAKEGKGVDHLLEMILLQAEMMDLKASTTIPAQGYILESRQLKGRGSVATVLCQQGTLRVNDYFRAGQVVGKVSSLVDSAGKSLRKVGPSVPVLVTGFSSMPAVGALFDVITDVEYKKVRSELNKLSTASHSHLTGSTDLQKFNLIVKADTQSSLEAILDAFKKFSKKEVKDIIVLRAGIGGITESDILLAESTNSTVVGFSVKAEQNAVLYARKAEIKIHLFDIIYKLLEEIEQMAAREKEIKMVLTKTGQATVLKVFNIKKLGVIAGCIVNDGTISAKGIAVAIRDRREIARGKIKSLQRDKKTVKEVHSGFECGFIVEGFEDWQEGDIAECYINMPS